MKFVVLTVVWILPTSWQQDSLETLNKTLDKLIRQSKSVEHFDSTENNHFSNPAVKEIRKRADKYDPYENISHSSTSQTAIDNQVSVSDILDAFGLKPSKKGHFDKDEILKEIAQKVEQGIQLNSKFDIDDLKELVEKPTFMEKKRSEEEGIKEKDILRRASETENDLLNKYPEIIVDRFTYPSKNVTNITTVTVVTEEKEDGQKNQGLDRNITTDLVKELKSLLSEVQKMNTVETTLKDGQSKESHLRQHFNGSPQQPAHVSSQQRTHGSLCGNVHSPYASPCALYQASTSFDRSSGPHLGANMQPNTWGDHNARQEMLMRISREQKLHRIRFITNLINNMMSRFVYRPLYGKK